MTYLRSQNQEATGFAVCLISTPTWCYSSFFIPLPGPSLKCLHIQMIPQVKNFSFFFFWKPETQKRRDREMFHLQVYPAKGHKWLELSQSKPRSQKLGASRSLTWVLGSEDLNHPPPLYQALAGGCWLGSSAART